MQGEDILFREDVRVTIAGSGLYEWLLKVVSVSGVIGGEDGELNGDAAVSEEPKKEKDDKKPMLGESMLSIFHSSI
jgi:gamma-tubulin complex component 2